MEGCWSLRVSVGVTSGSLFSHLTLGPWVGPLRCPWKCRDPCSQHCFCWMSHTFPEASWTLRPHLSQLYISSSPTAHSWGGIWAQGGSQCFSLLSHPKDPCPPSYLPCSQLSLMFGGWLPNLPTWIQFSWVSPIVVDPGVSDVSSDIHWTYGRSWEGRTEKMSTLH